MSPDDDGDLALASGIDLSLERQLPLEEAYQTENLGGGGAWYVAPRAKSGTLWGKLEVFRSCLYIHSHPIP
jgi:hypothetical protein